MLSKKSETLRVRLSQETFLIKLFDTPGFVTRPDGENNFEKGVEWLRQHVCFFSLLFFSYILIISSFLHFFLLCYSPC